MLSTITYRAVLNRNGYQAGDGLRHIVINIYSPLTKERVTVNTHIRVKESDFRLGKVQRTDPNHDLYNRKVARRIRRLMEYEDEMEASGITPSPGKIRDAWRNRVSKSATIAELVDSLIAPSAERKKSTVEGYRNLAKSVDEFRPGTKMSDLDHDMICRYRSWMKQKGLTENTAIGRLKLLRCLVNESIKRNLLAVENDPFRNIVIGEMKPHKEYLTLAEVRKLENVRLKGREAHIRDAFLFACMTGVRYSDFVGMKAENITRCRLTVDQLKTGHVVVLPLDKLFGGRPLEILSRYRSVEGFARIGINSTVNRVLKDIAARCGIRKNLHFHLARKCCGTLLNQFGMSMQEIQYILGHQRISTTAKHYSFTLQGQVERSLRKAFRARAPRIQDDPVQEGPDPLRDDGPGAALDS